MEIVLSINFHGKETVTKPFALGQGWNGLKCLAKHTLKTNDWYFKYFDEEGDSILGSTELEWQALQQIAKSHQMKPVEIFTLENDISQLSISAEESPEHSFVYVPQICCKSISEESSGESKEGSEICCTKPVVSQTKSNCCTKTDPSNNDKECCIKFETKKILYPEKIANHNNDEDCKDKTGSSQTKLMECRKIRDGPIDDQESKPICDVSSGCCSYQRPIPPDPEFDENDIPVKIKNDLLPQYKYTGESLRAVTLPLGPLGGGNIAIAGDGGIRQWQISNKVNHNAQVPDSFFAIKVDEDAVVLQSDTWYNEKGFRPAPYISDHIVPRPSIDLLAAVPGVKTVEITAKYPVVEVDYIDAKLKDITVHLEAWSPKIPHDSVASGVPVIIFDYHITNKRKAPVEVSLLGSLQNIVGWNGMNDIESEVCFSGYGGNANSLHTTNSLYGINMSNTYLKKNDEFNGNVFIAALTDSTDRTSTMLQYKSVKKLWAEFVTNPCLPGQGDVGVSSNGTTYNGAISNSRKIAAGGSTVFTYIIGWHFPNRMKDWYVSVGIPNTPIWVGNKYAKIWPGIEQVVDYTENKLGELRKLTYKFRDSMFNSNLPWQLIDSAAGRVSVLNSPTCMWHADGYFYGFEGCSNRSGCCPLNCTHVWNYEMALAYLYPDLERTMREIDLLFQITPHGVIPSRTACPLELRRMWANWKDYSMNPASTLICVDGEIGTVLKTYREVKNGASMKWLQTVWEPVKLIMRHWLDDLDTEKNGLVYGPQPNTYDVASYGYIVVFGLLYLCGLRAAEEMAKLLGDREFADECHTRFFLGSHNLDTVCFTNGKWYTQVVDPNHDVQVITDSSFLGGLYGQWWAHLLGLGYLLPAEHIRSNLKYIYQRNYVKSFDPATQKPRRFADQRDDGWVMGKWDNGVPPNCLLYSTELCWSGIIYPFASLLITEGLTEEGLDVLEKTRYLYDGTRRSPWNEIECGDHYARPMSAFSLFFIASGQDWSLTDNGGTHLSFNPTLNKNDFTGFFILPSCWGQYGQIVKEEGLSTGQISVDHGEVDLASLTLHVSCKAVEVKACSEIIPCNLSVKNGVVSVVFKSTLKIREGESLVVEMN